MQDMYKGTLTRAERGRIHDLMREGMGYRRIAEKLKVPPGRVKRYMKREEERPGWEYEHDVEPPRTVVFDLETTSLDTFFGRLIVACFLDLNEGRIHVRNIHDFGTTNSAEEVLAAEYKLLKWVNEQLENADIWMGHNITAFDMNFLNGRMSAHEPGWLVPARLHIDTYHVARYGMKGNPKGYSLENLADFFQLPVQKDKPSKHDWSDSVRLDEEAISRITTRCVEDCKVNALLWEKLRPYWHRWKGRA